MNVAHVGVHGWVSPLSYQEPFRVTGPLPSLVLQTEDMCQKYKPFFVEVCGALNQGFPFSPLQCR